MRYTYENTAAQGKPAEAYINGNKVDNAIVADTSRGEVIYVPQPVRVKKGSDEVYTRTLRGKVEVVFYDNL